MTKKTKPKPAVAVAAAATLASGELSQSLDQLQYEANSWAEQVEQHAYRAVEAGIECGRRLVAIKARLGHGKWNHWIGQSFDYDARTAQRYMSLAEYAGEIANQPTITRALAVIADIREEERAAEGKPSRRQPEPAAAREEAAQDAFDRTFGAEALGRHIDAVDPDEIGDDEPEPERDEQPRPTIATVSEASRKPAAVQDRSEWIAPVDRVVAGTISVAGKLRSWSVEPDCLYWISEDGIEQESDPLQLLQYIVNLLSEAEGSERQRVAAACRRVADVIEGGLSDEVADQKKAGPENSRKHSGFSSGCRAGLSGKTRISASGAAVQ